MAHEFTTSYLKDTADMFRYYKRLGDRAMEQTPDEGLFATLDADTARAALVRIAASVEIAALLNEIESGTSRSRHA